MPEPIDALARPQTPGPWDRAYVRQAVRHIARNCDEIEGDDPDFAWDRYEDAAAIAALPDWIAEADRLRRERDEARAEVEGLRANLAAMVTPGPAGTCRLCGERVLVADLVPVDGERPESVAPRETPDRCRQHPPRRDLAAREHRRWWMTAVAGRWR